MNFRETEEEKIERLRSIGKKEDEIVRILKQDREKLQKIKAPYIEIYGEDGPEIEAFLTMFKDKSNGYKMSAMKKYVAEAGEPGDRIPLLDWMDEYLLNEKQYDEVPKETSEEPKVEVVSPKKEEKVLTATRIDKHTKNDADHKARVEAPATIKATAYVPKFKRCSPNAVNKTIEEQGKVIYARSIKK